MTYVRNAWYVACWEQDVSAGIPHAVRILGEAIVVWHSGGTLVALADRCVHRHAALSLGRCEGATLRCMYHGMLYDEAGAVIAIPGQEQIPAKARAKRYPVVTKHSWVWIWMGDPAGADEALIPNAVGFEDPDWILGKGHLDYAAEASLINDNLLDFSHLTFVHANSFGAGSEFAEELPKLTALPRGIRYERWTVDTANPVGGHKADGLVDAYMTYDFQIPGILTMWNGLFQRGTALACQMGRPDFAKAIGGVSFTSQAVTPTGHRTARYFFSVGPHRDHGDEQLRDAHVAIALQAFQEDKVMIESQQQVIACSPGCEVIPTAHDKAITVFNGIVRKLSEAQNLSDNR